MAAVSADTFDFVYSSHCLEHMRDVPETLRNWTRILRPGGWLYVVVPDYVLYEKMSWPSRFNSDHKQSFSGLIDRSAVVRPNHWHLDGQLVNKRQETRSLVTVGSSTASTATAAWRDRRRAWDAAMAVSVVGPLQQPLCIRVVKCWPAWDGLGAGSFRPAKTAHVPGVHRTDQSHRPGAAGVGPEGGVAGVAPDASACGAVLSSEG
jgi:SAM-dependent methyltransferase